MMMMMIFAPVDIGEFKVPAEDSVEKGVEHSIPSRTGKISYLCDFLGIRRKYEIIHHTFAIFSKFFVDLFRDC